MFVRVSPGAGLGETGFDAGSGLRALGKFPGECWVSPVPVQRGAQGAWRYAHNDGALFAWLPIDDSAVGDMACAAYMQAFALMDKLGFSHLVRVWHYIPRLNDGEGDGTRYAAFCRGRRRALADNMHRGFCAATVIGAHDGTGLLLFVAARKAVTAVENPRQTSAHEYPQPALTDRPLFTRATAVPGGLFVSGTASIVGSESVAAGEPEDELQETLRNIGSLIDKAGFSFGETAYMKAYLADPYYLPEMREGLAAVSDCPTAIFHGDICRKELMVEVEALFRRA